MKLFQFLQRVPEMVAPAPLPAPAQPVAVIGDIHGRADLLTELLAELARRPEAATLRVIVAGDMIDRGPDSAAVLERLFALSQAPAPFSEVRCLMGNHERMALDFLATPETQAARWLAHGGDATLTSFGLRGLHGGGLRAGGPAFTQWRDALLAALGAERLAWLRTLPLLWREGRLVVAHAGADPNKQIIAQTERELLWGAYGRVRTPRRDGIWVAQGHVVVPAPSARDGRIRVDTGAWTTGRLSAAVIGPGGVSFLQTGLRVRASA